MASYNVTTSKHAVLTPSTVDTVTLGNSASYIMVSNRTTSGDPIFFTFGDAANNVAAPTVAGDDTYVATIGMTISLPFDGSNVQVKLISNSAQAYSVQIV